MRTKGQPAERDLADLKADAEWRHKWHRRLGRGEAEPEGRFYERISAALASRAAAPPEDARIESRLRQELWLGHGHEGLYGDDGEMQCGRCAPTWDYRRAPIDDVIAAAEKARLENAIRTLSASPPERPTPAAPQSGAEMIAAERKRQVDVEGWTPEHDDRHRDHEMLAAAYSYIRKAWASPRVEMRVPPSSWPWEASWWKPSADPIRNLIKAGALIAAEIDRLQRAAPATEGQE